MGRRPVGLGPTIRTLIDRPRTTSEGATPGGLVRSARELARRVRLLRGPRG